jgi:predicted peptidase
MSLTPNNKYNQWYIYSEYSNCMKRDMSFIVVEPTNPNKEPSNLFFFLNGAGLEIKNNIFTIDDCIEHLKHAIDLDILQEYADKCNCVFVLTHSDRFGMYTNWKNTSTNNNYESYHTDELYNLVLNNWNVTKDRSKIGLFGLSMGGFGVMNYYNKHPDKYN